MSQTFCDFPTELLHCTLKFLQGKDLAQLSVASILLNISTEPAAAESYAEKTGVVTPWGQYPDGAVTASLFTSFKRSLDYIESLPNFTRAPFSRAVSSSGGRLSTVCVGSQVGFDAISTMPPNVGDSWVLPLRAVCRGRYVLAFVGGANPYHGLMSVQVTSPVAAVPDLDVGEVDWFEDHITKYPVVKTLEIELSNPGPVNVIGTTIGKNPDSQGHWVCLTEVFLVSTEAWSLQGPTARPRSFAEYVTHEAIMAEDEERVEIKAERTLFGVLP